MPTSPFCPQCGNQFAADANFCSACGAHALPAPPPMAAAPQIVRPRHPRMIAGVCSGIAIHYGWDVALVRILYTIFVCLTLTTGLIVYAVAWLLLPDAQFALPASITPRTGNIVPQ